MAILIEPPTPFARDMHPACLPKRTVITDDGKVGAACVRLYVCACMGESAGVV